MNPNSHIVGWEGGVFEGKTQGKILRAKENNDR
jgi:hypothetical protein